MPECAPVIGARLLTGLLLGFCLLLTAIRYEHPLRADEAPADARLAEVKKKIKRMESELAANALELKQARTEMLELDRELQAAREQQQGYETELAVKTESIRALTQKKTGLQRQMADDYASIRRVIRARYGLWRRPMLQLLLTQDDLSGIQRQLRYADYFVTELNREVSAARRRLRDSTQIEAALKLEADRLRQLRMRSQTHAAALTETADTRRGFLVALNAKLAAGSGDLKSLREDERRLAALLRKLRAAAAHAPATGPAATAPFAALKGKLPWPAAGEAVKAERKARQPDGANWSGVLIKSAAGTPVKAIAAGQVVFADWFVNLGLLVIIDHGEGYMSLYGHNQAVSITAGQQIDAGAVIATVGDSGGQTETSVYFEIRHNGEPENPGLWCK